MKNNLPDESLLSKMKSAVESSMDGIALLDHTGVYYYMNEVHLSMFGYDDETELIGKTWESVYDQPEIDRINKDIFPVLMEQKKWRGETIGKSKTGKPVYQEITLTVSDDGGIICICRDIEQRIINRKQIRVHEKIMEQTNSMLMITNRNREITWVNEAFCNTTGYSMQEVLGQNPGHLLQGKNSNRAIIKKFREALISRTPFNCELLNYKKDGSLYWVDIKCQPLFNEQGQIDGFFAIEEDITERKRKDSLLHESKLRLEMAIEGTGAALWDWDISNNTVYYSPSWKKALGYNDKDIRFDLNEWTDRIHPDDREKTMVNLNRYLEGGSQTYEAEVRLRHKDGHYLYFLDRGQITLRDDFGRPSRMTGIAFNISELKETQQKLRESESRWYAALEGSEFGVWEWDLEKDSLYFSPKLKELYGYRPEELHPTTEFWIRTCHPDDLEVSKFALDNHLENKTHQFQSDRRVLHRDGTYRWFQSRGIVIERDAEGHPLKVVGSVVDITERKKLEEELIQAKNSAEANVKTKRRFLANISHEIRTPMHAIMGIAEQLTHSTLNDKQEYYLRIINDSARTLLGIINDVLDISKIEEGKLKIDKVDFGMREILYNVFNLFSDTAEQKNLRYKLNFDEQLNRLFSGDPARVRQILLNIISNALKFTERGTITISCRLLSRSDNQYNVLFECTDTGIGMSEEMKKKLFEDFSQEDESFERKYGGSGLGLAITNELVHLMNGSITVKSIKDEGTTISIVLPFSESGTILHNVPKMINPAAGKTSLSSLSVLVAEDNQFNRLLLQIMLGNNEISYDMADNGLQAVELATRKNYDLILMDIQMPEMDGIEATKKIRSISNKNIPIIAITANAVEEELNVYMKEGLTDYLTKPFDEYKLLKKIREYIS
jgi:PAS domain S-box-containing protein